MQRDWCALSTGRTAKLGFRKKPKLKIDYNLFAGDKSGKIHAPIKYKSAIMQIMSIIWVKSTLTAMEISDSIISPSTLYYVWN